jgi:cytochrome c
MALGRRGVFVVLATLMAAPALAQSADVADGNAAKGKLVFLQCQACHAVQPGGPALVGPDLAGVYGRPAASLPGYDYSAALKASHIVWNDKELNDWLTDPSALVPGTKMAFTGIASPALRADVIAYLKTLK